jgi:hypothetical protein
MFPMGWRVFEEVTQSRVLRFENEVSFNEIRDCYVVTFSELAPLREKVTTGECR